MPENVPTALEYTLVEVHFLLHHYCIDGQEEQFDSFSGTIEQVIVLKQENAPPRKAYKRKNILDGPYHSESSHLKPTDPATANDPGTLDTAAGGNPKKNCQYEPMLHDGCLNVLGYMQCKFSSLHLLVSLP
jgi:hypothetical protein